MSSSAHVEVSSIAIWLISPRAEGAELESLESPEDAPVAAGVVLGVLAGVVLGVLLEVDAGVDGGPAQAQVSEPTLLIVLREQLIEENEHPALAFEHALTLAPVSTTLPFMNAL